MKPPAWFPANERWLPHPCQLRLNVNAILSSFRHVLRALGFDVIRMPSELSWIEQRRLSSLRAQPDFTVKTTDILGPPLRLISNHAFAFLYREVFGRQIYRFQADSATPYILDCGANIGLSTIYFKRLYPRATVICFEPDLQAYEALQENTGSFGLDDVTLINKGLWDREAELNFQADPQSTSGRVSQSDVHSEASPGTDSVSVTSLRNYLDRPVDFLKMDIEGAEAVVLRDCQDLLSEVQCLFVECHSYAGQPQHIAEVLAIMSAAGYRLYVESWSAISRQPFVKCEVYKGMDTALNVFGIR